MEKLNNYEEFTEVTNKKTVFIVFYSNWCPICKKLKFTFYEVLENYPNISVYYVDLYDNIDITKKIKITSTPTTILYSDGKMIDKYIGNLDYSDIEEIILSLNQ